MNYKILLLIPLFLSCKSENTSSVKLITAETYITYGEFVKGVNKLICDSFPIELTVKNLNPRNFCDQGIVHRNINYFSISDDKFSRVNINLEDSLLKKELENYIVNPSKREDNAPTPEKSIIILKLNDDTSSEKLFEILSRLGNAYKEISLEYKLNQPIAIRFFSVSENPIESPNGYEGKN